jgi:response regulator RpfG family c-di-GMP phosphodiesterase
VWYIDDFPPALGLCKATLESQGYCVKIASSGYTAVKMLEETSEATGLLEYKLEGMDAEAVACHIKQRFPDRRSSYFQCTARCLSESCGWWMNM